MMESTDLSGREVHDRDGEKVGTITDVIAEPATLEAEWVVVKMGRLGGEHLVPIEAIDLTGDEVVVRFAKGEVKTAPKVKEHTSPSRAEKDSLLRHYGLATT